MRQRDLRSIGLVDLCAEDRGSNSEFQETTCRTTLLLWVRNWIRQEVNLVAVLLVVADLV